MAGVTIDGFVPKSITELTADINSSMRASFGSNFDVSPDSPDGQIIGVLANIIANTWQQAEAAYNSYYPSATMGLGLDKLCELNGVTRITNTPTSVVLTFTGVDGTLIPKGFVAKTEDGLEFETVADANIPQVVTAKCKTVGEIYIIANEVNIMGSEIIGVTSVTNLEPGLTGVTYEQDPALRARREALVVNAGTSSIEAIYSGIRNLRLPYVAIIENYESVAVDGIPAHSFLTVVEGGTPEEIAKVIYKNKPIGIKATGDIVTTVSDSKGHPHQIGFSRPTPVEVSINVVIKNLPGSSIGGEEKVAEALVNYINSLLISEDVIWSKLFDVALSATPNISVTSINIKFSSGPTFGTADLPISIQQRARTDPSKVVVSGS